MPNWCNSTICFKGEPKAVEDLFKKVKEYTSKEIKHSDFGPRWLGNVCLGFGIETPKSISTDYKFRCRGKIISISDELDDEEDECLFWIETETAWDVMVQMWCEIIRRFYSDERGNPKIVIHYMAYEFGNDVYCTNDMDMFGHNPIELYIKDERTDKVICGAFDNEGAIAAINDVLKDRNLNIKNLSDVNDILDENDDIHIDYIKLEYRPIDDTML